MMQALATFTLVDRLAPLFFLLCWVGYARWADTGMAHGRSLMARIHEYRFLWMQEMLARENRVLDLQIVAVLAASINFFTSSAVLVIGAGLAILGSGDRVMAIVAQLPFAERSPPLVWDAKVMLIVVVFVHAFFKLTWSLRQFNYVSILIGAAPPFDQAGSARGRAHAQRTALVVTRASLHFHKALRSYYFGLAALGWALSPYLFMATSAWVVLVLYRREFRSETLAALRMPELE